MSQKQGNITHPILTRTYIVTCKNDSCESAIKKILQSVHINVQNRRIQKRLKKSQYTFEMLPIRLNENLNAIYKTADPNFNHTSARDRTEGI